MPNDQTYNEKITPVVMDPRTPEAIPNWKCVECHGVMLKKSYSISGHMLIWFHFCDNPECKRIGLVSMIGDAS